MNHHHQRDHKWLNSRIKCGQAGARAIQGPEFVHYPASFGVKVTSGGERHVYNGTYDEKHKVESSRCSPLFNNDVTEIQA